MLYFLIWKALKSYRYLYIRYFISSGIIIRSKISLNIRAAVRITAHERALLWHLVAKHQGISFLLTPICFQSCFFSLYFSIET